MSLLQINFKNYFSYNIHKMFNHLLNFEKETFVIDFNNWLEHIETCSLYIQENV